MNHEVATRRNMFIPRMLSFTGVGLDITDRRVRVLGLESQEHGMRVEKYGEVPVPPGVIVAGTIKRPLEFSAVLQSLARAHGITYARVSLPEERAYIVHMGIPRVEEEEVREIIMTQLEEYVPLKPEEAVFDYFLTDNGKGGETMTVLVAVMPKDVIDVYVDVLESVGITPLSFEIESQAIARAVIPRDTMCTTNMIVDIGGMRTGVSVVTDGVVRFTSTLDMGSESFTEVIMTEFHISEKEAREKKNIHAVGGSDTAFTQAIRQPLETLSEELNKLCMYWRSYHIEKKNEHSIESIFLCGGGANLSGLAPYIERTIGIPVAVANPWINVCDFDEYVPPIPRNEAFGYATAIGLALPEDVSGATFSL